ncbi:MAG: hypothetical protein U0S36_00770 [Candidatus Nanopelagicales bacterium]
MSTVTVLLHGAGSCPPTALALLGPAVASGSRAVAMPTSGDVERAVADLDALVAGLRAAGEHPLRVGGISLGAHAAALWAARTGAAVELVLAMPAWTGAPDHVAALTAAAADDVEDHGVAAVLARLDADPATAGDWVLEELRRGWTSYAEDDLVRTLRAAGRSPGPATDDLAALRGPVAVVALADDPLHPETVARRWAEAVPDSGLAVVGRHEPAGDRGALGRAGAGALERLSGSR